MVLNIVLNVILCAMIAAGIIFGIKRGFISMAAKPVKVICALGLAIALCTPFADAVVHPIIDAPIANYVKDFLYTNCQSITEANVTEELPTLLKISAAVVGMDIKEIAGDATEAGKAILDAIAENLTAPVVEIIATVISFFLLYFILKILIGILIWFINAIFQNGVFGVLNKIVGTVFGAACSILAGWALVSILEFVFNLPVFDTVEAVRNFDGKFLYEFYKNYNPIELMLSF